MVHKLDITLGSSSKIKQQAVKIVFTQLFNVSPQITTQDVASHVPEAPHNQQTYQGALNRALALARKSDTLCIGIESGIASRYGMVFEEAWSVIILQGRQYTGYSSGLMLPAGLVKLMDEGTPHDQAIQLFDKKSTGEAKDTWAVYTNEVLSRQLSLEEAIRNAAVQLDPVLLRKTTS